MVRIKKENKKYVVYEFVDGKGYVERGEFLTFVEAHDFAEVEVCTDLFNTEYYGKYFFSDENSPELPYKGLIDSSNYVKSYENNRK